MLLVRFDFPAHRYHGTRWGTHVNEADIDWPPSPWRLLRAILAAGYNRLGWQEGELPEEGRSLIEKLASETPTYHLPQGAVTAHTRHYMPLYKEGSSSKILDAFIRLRPQASALFVQWSVVLTTADHDLLRLLLPHISYLGRAESWVEGSVVDTVPPGWDPCGVEAIAGARPIELLAPMAAHSYEIWRQGALDQATATELERLAIRSTQKGKTPPTRLTAAQQRKVDRSLPTDLVDALSTGTGVLRKAGWSRPPGSWTRRYWRPVQSLDHATLSPPRRPRGGPRPQAVLFQVTSNTLRSPVLPSLSSTLRRAQQLHTRLASLSDGHPDAWIFTGMKNGQAVNDHRHTHILPMSLRHHGSRRKTPQSSIDHIALWCTEGYSGELLTLLLELRRTWIKGAELGLAIIGTGDGRSMANAAPLFGRSTVWQSATPYVPPRFLKKRGRNGLVGQLERGLEQRGLPAPVEVELETDSGWSTMSPEAKRASWWRQFELERDRGSGVSRPPQRATFGIRLTFPEPVDGPICLGFGAHFGLGRFEPSPT